MIEAKNICFSYGSGRRALKNVSFTLKDGSFTGLTGKTGSGKTTLSKILRGLLVPSSGTVLFDSMEVKTGKNLDSGIGLVFQFPEYQLFEDTVLNDLMFGPKSIELLKLIPVEPVYSDLIHQGTEIEDIASLLPGELNNYLESLQEAILHNYQSISLSKQDPVKITLLFDKNEYLVK